MIIKKDPLFIQSYLEDSSNLKDGFADMVYIPECLEEVSSVLRDVNMKKIPITISGAGTGQSGGRVPFGGVVLSTERLNRIKRIEKTDDGGYAVAESGVTIKELKKEAEKAGLFYTYDPTEQNAFVGGTIATNASGARSFRYGSTRNYVNALRICLADGTTLSLRRDNTFAKGMLLNFKTGEKSFSIKLPKYKMPDTKHSAGYFVKENMDIIDLFIGQEGTLGIILEAELRLLPLPKGFFNFCVFFKTENEALKFVNVAREENPLSIEYFDKNCLELIREKYKEPPAWANSSVLIEDEIPDSEEAILEKWETLLSKEHISLDSTWVAIDRKHHKEFLQMRHLIPEHMNEMVRKSGFSKISTDLAVPYVKMEEMFRYYIDVLNTSGIRHFIFGHIGNAHLHVNILPKNEKEFEKSREIQRNFVKKAISLKGTVSAEHGIGKAKRKFLEMLYGDDGVEQMFRVKKELDPNLILGRGNIFGESYLHI